MENEEFHEEEIGNLAALTKRLGVDFLAALTAAFSISPFITIVDRAIMENASGRNPLIVSIKTGIFSLIKSPHIFISSRPFRLIFFVYSSTYTTANTIDTVCKQNRFPNQYPKFFGTSLVNIVTCIFKDRQFTRMFGIAAPRPLPLGTYALFATRDSLTIMASFNMPALMANSFLDRGWTANEEMAKNISQLICPAVLQFLSTPLHLMGLDLYNRPQTRLLSRARFVKREYWKSSLARIARIGPAFGIGGIGNRVIREKFYKVL
ncbi:hypothetical protein G9A89_010574 [Geosiphon pyriformis]|nr:hypothetical protein G9A89_010574 [Geosiphon pyriformis]